MNGIFKKTLATLLSLTMVLGWAAFARDVRVEAGSYASASFVRIHGSDRYDTANRIAAEGWDYADTVVLASAKDYPDALAGAPLAYALDAPVLLVSGDSVPGSVMEQIYSLGASDIVILGGNAAVSASIENELTGKNFTVERISGKTRYETSVKVAEKLRDLSGPSDDAFVVSGENYPDALAVSPVASIKGAPIIYSNKKGTIDSGSAALLSESGVSIAYVIGGTAAISDSVRTELGRSGVSSVTRINGSSRYDTALKVADHFMDIFPTKGIAFATGENYPDALAGGVFAAKKGMPVLLTNGKLNAEDSSSIFLTASAYTDGKSFTENLVDFINRFQPEEVFVFGGEKAVPNTTVDSYFDGETWSDDPAPPAVVNGSLTVEVDAVDALSGLPMSKISVVIREGVFEENESTGEDELVSGSGEMLYEGNLDSDSGFSFDLPPGDYYVLVRVEMDDALREQIRNYVHSNCSPDHVHWTKTGESNNFHIDSGGETVFKCVVGTYSCEY